ncbi:MAG: hypothetical protein N2545_01125 [Thermoflexales bacterium]|nr:hypothetical protein [Thermoflexales bacterium]
MSEIETYTPQPFAPAVEQALIAGDLSALSAEQRLSYYRAVCQSLGLNPLTRPFEYLRLGGRLVLYATRAAADQLRALRGVSVEIVAREERDGIYIVHARARDRDGRVDEAIGAVPLTDAQGKRLTGEQLANATMKAETKAKRRVTLSICGLGWLDESEVDSVPNAQRVSEEELMQSQPRSQAQLPSRPQPQPQPKPQVQPQAQPQPQQESEIAEALVQVFKQHRETLGELTEKARQAWRSKDDAQMLAVLREALAVLEAQGVDTSVWSNFKQEG